MPTRGNDGEKKRRLRGQYKHRKVMKVREGVKVCRSVFTGIPCPYGSACKFSHEASASVAEKLPDLEGVCPFFSKYGTCKFGQACRFVGTHINQQQDTSERQVEATPHMSMSKSEETNALTMPLLTALRKRTVTFPRAMAYFQEQAKRGQEQERVANEREVESVDVGVEHEEQDGAHEGPGPVGKSLDHFDVTANVEGNRHGAEAKRGDDLSKTGPSNEVGIAMSLGSLADSERKKVCMHRGERERERENIYVRKFI